jgi:AGCS family alanine or glycine:cation symporter
MTAFVVIVTMYTKGGPLAVGDTSIMAPLAGLTKTNLAQSAFASVFGETVGNSFVAICLLFFAFSTIIGWYFFGKQNMLYLFGKKSVVPYTVIAMVFIVLGTFAGNDLVWALTDMFNQLMVLPNAIALVVLGGVVAATAKAVKRNKKDK